MKSLVALSSIALVLSLFHSICAADSATESKPVILIVKLPAEAVLELLGQKTEGTGGERRFVTPPLEVGKRYPYSVKAAWMVNGKPQTAEMTISITAGQTHEVNFGGSTATPTAAGGGSSQEQEVLNLVNAERARVGAPAVMWNEVLANASRTHSANMARQGVLSHDLNGSFVTRIQQSGVGVSPGGENIGQGQNSPSEIVRSWMNSDGHRANILNAGFTQMGAGVSSGSGGMFWTQVFGR